MIYIYAPHHMRAELFAKERGWGPDDFEYINRSEKLRGLRGGTLYVLTSYPLSNRALYDMQQAIHIGMMNGFDVRVDPDAG